MKTTKNLQIAALLVVAAMLPLQAMAGSGGTEFTQVYDQLTGWANGTLGKVLGVAALLVGLGVGVIKQSVIAAVVGIALVGTALISATLVRSALVVTALIGATLIVPTIARPGRATVRPIGPPPVKGLRLPRTGRLGRAIDDAIESRAHQSASAVAARRSREATARS